MEIPVSDRDPAVAVDLGGTNVRAAVVSRGAPIRQIHRRPLKKSSPNALLEVMAACVEDALAEAASAAANGPTPAIAGIGVAMKGFVDHKTGITVSSGFLGMKNVPVAPFLADRFGVAVRVMNDVQAATIGEILYGAGRTYDDFVYLNVGTGIAAGLVFGGKLYRGAANLSGEFGHITVDRHGQPCACARAGCLERVVSGPGIVTLARAKIAEYPESTLVSLNADGSGELNATTVFDHALSGDAAAKDVTECAAAYLGDGLVNLINLLNPAAIILGGGVFSAAAPGSGTAAFVELLERHVRRFGIAEAVKSLSVFEVSSLEPDKAGLIGAAGLVLEKEALEG